jgi:serine/threonine protein phosphatase PrpC
MSGMSDPALCPHCGSPVVPGDAFCEGCGHELVAGAPQGEAAVAPEAAAPHERPRTHQLVPNGDPSPAGRPCELCGAPIAEDGFCTNCGAKARTVRDHWTETPAGWVGGVCDKGISHARNEDGMALWADAAANTHAVLLVCDGVTTAPDSDRASLAAARAARDVLAAAVSGDAPPVDAGVAARVTAWEPIVRKACAVANAEAVAIARSLGDPPEPPSCTYVAAVVDHDLLVVSWCGDSRAYWIADDGDGSEQLSIDHSLGTEMIRAGMPREEAEARADCHTITRWLGADSVDSTCEIRTRSVDAPGWLLVVSDGMWNYASTPAALGELIAIARRDGAATPTAIAESLAAVANDRGGHDNISVVLARCEPALPSPQSAGGS